MPQPFTERAVRFAGPMLAEMATEGTEDRLVRLSFSSELPALRNYPSGTAWEVLGHKPQEVDLTRLNSGAAPLLKDHRQDLDHMVGNIDRAWIEGGRGRAIVRLAQTAEGEAMLARIRSGEVQSVSVGYAVRASEFVGEREGLPILRATAWEPVEISLVAAPMDPSVGIGRALPAPLQSSNPPVRKGTPMPTPAPLSATPAVNPAALNDERQRVIEINAMARDFNVPAETVAEAISTGASAVTFGREALHHARSDASTATRSRNFGAPAVQTGEAKPYSLLAAVEAQVSGDWRGAGFEREVGEELRRQRGRAPEGFYVPAQALVGRALVTTTSAPSLIGTDHMDSAFVDALRPEVQVMNLGATVLSGLIENVSIPRMTAGTSAQWIAEDAAAAESSPTFDSVPLTMKQLSAHARISRRQLKQSLPALDQILRNDLRAQIAVALDRAAIAGAGTATEPRGILNTAGLAVYESSLYLEWGDVTALMALVEGGNISATSLGFLTNYKVKSKLLSAARFDGGDTPMLAAEEKDPRIAGHRVGFTSLVPANLGASTDRSALIFGNWADLLIGQWGGIDLITDDATEATKGNVRIVAHSEWDIALRHVESFAAIRDIITR